MVPDFQQVCDMVDFLVSLFRWSTKEKPPASACNLLSQSGGASCPTGAVAEKTCFFSKPGQATLGRWLSQA